MKKLWTTVNKIKIEEDPYWNWNWKRYGSPEKYISEMKFILPKSYKHLEFTFEDCDKYCVIFYRYLR